MRDWFEMNSSYFKFFPRIKSRSSTALKFDRAMAWIESHNSSEGGICVSSINATMYPEVTGYFIPTLLNWGESNLAIQFGNALVPAQQPDGSFLDSGSTTKCVFDTGQIIRGLLALSQETPEEKYKESLEKAVSWVASTIDIEGKVNAPDVQVWGGVIPFGILLYSLEPALRAAKYLQNEKDGKKIEIAIRKLLADEEIEDFTSVSHFHAYILEALVDLGETDRAKVELNEIIKLSNKKGWTPGKPGKMWVCSTALFQYSVVCYKLGMLAEGNKLFLAGARLQNRTGGWYGSYGFAAKLLAPLGRLNAKFGMYFPRTEIPWVNKYFLDSLDLRLRLNFEHVSQTFSDQIDLNDGRLNFILETIRKTNPQKILDLGCGKGRYASHIAQMFPDIEMHACDISISVTKEIKNPVIVETGSLLRTKYQDNSFDLVLTVEALEHAVNIKAALRELDRIVVPAGTILIVDKNIKHLGRLRIPDWERWFDVKKLSNDLTTMGYQTEIIENMEYESRKDGLFFGIIGTKNG